MDGNLELTQTLHKHTRMDDLCVAHMHAQWKCNLTQYKGVARRVSISSAISGAVPISTPALRGAGAAGAFGRIGKGTCKCPG